jgi:toxin ParE1/3/4
MARVVRREAAKRDLVGHFAYIGQHAGVEVAERFVLAAEGTFRELAKMPPMGAPGKVRQGKFAGLRLWRVRGFPKYLIACRPLKDGVRIERVFHAAQDYQRVLGR